MKAIRKKVVQKNISDILKLYFNSCDISNIDRTQLDGDRFYDFLQETYGLTHESCDQVVDFLEKNKFIDGGGWFKKEITIIINLLPIPKYKRSPRTWPDLEFMNYRFLKGFDEKNVKIKHRV